MLPQVILYWRVMFGQLGDVFPLAWQVAVATSFNIAQATWWKTSPTSQCADIRKGRKCFNLRRQCLLPSLIKPTPFPLIFWMFSILDKIFHDYETYNVNTFWFAPEIIQVCKGKWVFTSMCFDAASLYSIFTHNLPDHPIIGEYRHIWRWPYAPGRNI